MFVHLFYLDWSQTQQTTSPEVSSLLFFIWDYRRAESSSSRCVYICQFLLIVAYCLYVPIRVKSHSPDVPLSAGWHFSQWISTGIITALSLSRPFGTLFHCRSVFFLFTLFFMLSPHWKQQYSYLSNWHLFSLLIVVNSNVFRSRRSQGHRSFQLQLRVRQ